MQNDELIERSRKLARAFGVPHENASDAEIDSWLVRIAGMSAPEIVAAADRANSQSLLLEEIAALIDPHYMAFGDFAP